MGYVTIELDVDDCPGVNHLEHVSITFIDFIFPRDSANLKNIPESIYIHPIILFRLCRLSTCQLEEKEGIFEYI